MNAEGAEPAIVIAVEEVAEILLSLTDGDDLAAGQIVPQSGQVILPTGRIIEKSGEFFPDRFVDLFDLQVRARRAMGRKPSSSELVRAAITVLAGKTDEELVKILTY